jgi:hypothetical protein
VFGHRKRTKWLDSPSEATAHFLKSFLAQSEVNVSGRRGLVNTQELCNGKIPVGERAHGSASEEKVE